MGLYIINIQFSDHYPQSAAQQYFMQINLPALFQTLTSDDDADEVFKLLLKLPQLVSDNWNTNPKAPLVSFHSQPPE